MLAVRCLLKVLLLVSLCQGTEVLTTLLPSGLGHQPVVATVPLLSLKAVSRLLVMPLKAMATCRCRAVLLVMVRTDSIRPAAGPSRALLVSAVALQEEVLLAATAVTKTLQLTT